jgi:hypothetical protein
MAEMQSAGLGPIEITLWPDDPSRAIAVGRFRNPRTAELMRQ